MELDTTKFADEFAELARRFGLSPGDAMTSLASGRQAGARAPSRMFPIVSPTRGSAAMLAQIFDDLEEGFTVLNAIVECSYKVNSTGNIDLNDMQLELCKKFRQTAVQFAHDLLLAEGDRGEIRRRLKIGADFT